MVLCGGMRIFRRCVKSLGRLLPVIEKELGLVVYPDQNTCWHYDDKIAQYYLLKRWYSDSKNLGVVR